MGISRLEAVAHRQPAYQAELAVAKRHPGVSVFDPMDSLCSDVCPSASEGTILYQDPTHLSLDGSLRLAPDLRAVLSDVL